MQTNSSIREANTSSGTGCIGSRYDIVNCFSPSALLRASHLWTARLLFRFSAILAHSKKIQAGKIQIGNSRIPNTTNKPIFHFFTDTPSLLTVMIPYGQALPHHTRKNRTLCSIAGYRFVIARIKQLVGKVTCPNSERTYDAHIPHGSDRSSKQTQLLRHIHFLRMSPNAHSFCCL